MDITIYVIFTLAVTLASVSCVKSDMPPWLLRTLENIHEIEKNQEIERHIERGRRRATPPIAVLGTSGPPETPPPVGPPIATLQTSDIPDTPPPIATLPTADIPDTPPPTGPPIATLPTADVPDTPPPTGPPIATLPTSDILATEEVTENENMSTESAILSYSVADHTLGYVNMSTTFDNQTTTDDPELLSSVDAAPSITHSILPTYLVVGFLVVRWST